MNDVPTPSTLDRLAQAANILSAVHETGSFAAAAMRLDLDPSAVRHRVRSLESTLGFNLFERTTRRMHLTRAGQIICDAAIRSRDTLQTALETVAQLRSSSTVRLSLPSSVAMKWLVPLLPEACQDGLDLSLDVREDVTDLDQTGSDAAIRFGPGPYPGEHATKLASCWLHPVASPAYLSSLGPDWSVDHVGRARFLADRRGEVDNTDYCWAAYYGVAPSGPVVPTAPLMFERADLMLQAAIGGLGIGLGRSLLVEHDVRNGLLKTAGPARRSRSSYWFVTSHDLAGTTRIKETRDWLTEKAGETLRLIGV